MSSEHRLYALILAGVVLLVSAACSPSASGPEVAYRGAETERPLEVPPDLIRPESPAAASIPALQESDQLLPDFDDVQIVRVGANSWIELRGKDPEVAWETVKAFLRSEGLAVRAERPATGAIDTEWARRYDSPRRGGITGFLDSVLGRGDTGIEDRYQFRLERMQGGSGTRVFIAHWMAEDRPQADTPRRVGAGGFAWHHAASDPAVVQEMQRRLLIHAGVRERQAARLVGTDGAVTVSPFDAEYNEVGDVGTVVLRFDDIDRARARLSDSLAQVGADIIDSDPERGLYRVSWVPPGETEGGSAGIFGFFGGGGEGPRAREFEVQMRVSGDTARVVAAAAGAGLDPARSGTSGVPPSGTMEQALLQRINDAFNGVLIHGPVIADRRGAEERERDRDAGGTVTRSRR